MDEFDFSDVSDSALLTQIEAASKFAEICPPSTPIGKMIEKSVEAAIAEWDTRHPD